MPGDQLDEDIVLPDDTRPQLPGADGTGTNVPDSVRNPGQIPIPEDSGGNSTLKDPTKVENSGAVKAEVTPKRKQTKDEKIGGKQENTHGDVVCTTQKRRITAGSGASFLLNPEIGAIWPGAILGAESIAKGQFSPALSAGRRDGKSLSQIRQPIEISLSLRNIDGKNTKTLDPPSRGNFRTALDELLSQYDRQTNTPAKMNTTIHQVHSSEQLDVTLGLHYDSNKLDIDNTFDFSSESETNKLLAKFWQSYYTVDVSLPNSVANGLVTDQSKYLNRNDVIVNNVTFGRLLLFSAESKYDQTRIENALSVALDSGAKSANVDLDVETKQTLRDMKINVQVLGGAATDGAKTISEPGEGAFQAIKQFIQDGATYDPKTSPGVPIAYQTKYVSNFDTANTYLTTTYRERNCRPTTSAYRVTNLSWKVLEESDPGNEEEIYGEIRVTGQAEKSDGFVILNITPKGNSDDGRIWKRSKSSHLNIKGNERKHLSTDATIVFDDAHELKRGSSYIRVAAKPREGPDLRPRVRQREIGKVVPRRGTERPRPRRQRSREVQPALERPRDGTETLV